MTKINKVENVLGGFSKHILSELDKETAELEKKSAHSSFCEAFRKVTSE